MSLKERHVDNKQKTVLIIGAGKEAVTGIRQAKELGYTVYVSDGDLNAPGIACADGFIQASVYDPQETRQAILGHDCRDKIDGVLAIACDAPVSVSVVAEALYLENYSIETATLATNKLLMKQAFHKAGIPTPWFRAVESIGHLRHLIQKEQKVLVLKPVDSRGSRGVLRLLPDISHEEITWAYELSVSYSGAKQLIVEHWIDGPQLSTESVIWDEESQLVAVADRNYDQLENHAPFIMENGGNTPSVHSPQIDLDLNEIIAAASKAIGLQRGTVKGDVVIGPEGPVVIEIAARLSGGYFCTHTIPKVYGVNLIKAALEICTGQKPDFAALKPQIRCVQGNRHLFLKEGVIKSVQVSSELVDHSNVAIFKLNIKSGDKIEKVTDHTRRHGVIMTFCETREKAVELAERCIDSVDIVYG